jgi:uncharacterized protein
MSRRRLLLAGMSGFASAAVPLAASGQAFPSPADSRAYRGFLAAAMANDVPTIGQLAQSGARPDALRDSHGRTPLHVAAHYRRREAIRALAAVGADPNALEHDRYDMATIAAVADDVETLLVALAVGNKATNITSRYDGTALIAAAHLGHDGAVRALIGAGAPLDHVNNLKWTALIEAIVLGNGGTRHVATLRALVEAGANVNLPDGQGATPLSLAKRRGYLAMVKILESAGGRE